MKKEELFQKLQKVGKDRFILLFLAGILCVIIAMPMENAKKESGQKNVAAENTETAQTGGASAFTMTGAAAGAAEETVSEAEQAGTANQILYAAGGNDSEMERYRQALCSGLKQFLQKMEGAGEVEVYITLKSSAELVVERSSPYSRKSEEETEDGNTRQMSEMENNSEVVLYENGDGSQTPLIVKQNAPLVSGVVVAAQGGDRAYVKTNITEALEALFGLEEHKIKVVKLGT